MKIKTVIAENSEKGKGMRLAQFGSVMRQKHLVEICKQPEGSWRNNIGSRETLFNLDPRGPEAMVRYNANRF